MIHHLFLYLTTLLQFDLSQHLLLILLVLVFIRLLQVSSAWGPYRISQAHYNSYHRLRVTRYYEEVQQLHNDTLLYIT